MIQKKKNSRTNRAHAINGGKKAIFGLFLSIGSGGGLIYDVLPFPLSFLLFGVFFHGIYLIDRYFHIRKGKNIDAEYEYADSIGWKAYYNQKIRSNNKFSERAFYWLCKYLQWVAYIFIFIVIIVIFYSMLI